MSPDSGVSPATRGALRGLRLFSKQFLHELRRSRSELHTGGDRKRKLRIFEPSRGFDTPMTAPLNNSRFLCRSRPRYPQLLKAALNVFVVEGQTLDDPSDLTEKTTAQTGFDTHRGLDEQASSIRPGAITLDTPSPGRVLKNMDGPQGPAEEDDKVFIKRLKSTYSSPGSGVWRLSTLLS